MSHLQIRENILFIYVKDQLKKKDDLTTIGNKRINVRCIHIGQKLQRIQRTSQYASHLHFKLHTNTGLNNSEMRFVAIDQMQQI